MPAFDLRPYYGNYAVYKQRFGEHANDQRYQQIVIRKRTAIKPGQLVPTSVDLILAPYLKIVSVPNRMVGHPLDSASNDIGITQNDLLVEGIPRLYTEQQLTKDVSGWIIGATLNAQRTKAIAGKFYLPVFLDRSNMLSWQMVLREPSDPVAV